MVVLAMGRRWGKTVLGEVLTLTFAAMGGKVAWVVPTYKNGNPLWRMVRRELAAHRAAGLVRINDQLRTVEFDARVGGGFLGMYTGEDNCDAMRGEDFDLVVVDEAAKLNEIAFTDAIYPTLADRSGHALLISTPRGQNWFWRWWALGQDETQADVRSFQAPTSDNPNPRIREAARKARERVTERTYQQEWLAEFLADGGAAFQNLAACVTATARKAPRNGAEQYVIGCDVAKHEDYTVVSVFDRLAREQVAIERWNRCEWSLTKARIIALAKLWNNALVYLDATGVGDAIYDDLRRAGLRIEGYKITGATRTPLLENLILLVEQQRVGLLDHAVQLNEMRALQPARMPSGTITYRVPDGMHDDCIFANALACLPLSHDHRALPAEAIDALRMPGVAFGGTGLMGKTF